MRRKKKSFVQKHWKKLLAAGAFAGAGLVTADAYLRYDGFKLQDVHHETWVISLLLVGVALLA